MTALYLWLELLVSQSGERQCLRCKEKNK